MTLLINTEEARRVLRMEDCLADLDQAYKDLAGKEAVTAPAGGRWDVWVPVEREKWYIFGSMQAASRRLGVFAMRIKSDMRFYLWENEHYTLDKYCVRPGKYCGLIMLFSIANGELLAILNDGHIQHMRVGATAGVAAKYMAREDASAVGIFGSGGMARTYLEAFTKVRKVTRCLVYSPTKAHRDAYAAEMSDRLDIDVIPVDSPDQVTQGADIVAGCTDSAEPVILAEYLRPGMFVAPVLPGELTPEAVAKMDVIVKHNDGGAEGFFVGSEDEYAAVPGGRMDLTYEGVDRKAVPTLADLVSGKTQGRATDDQLTCYYNVPGSGLQFAAVAYRTYELAKAAGLGREIPTDWFLQDERN